MKPVNRSDFFSRGERCAADLYLPDGGDRPPVVIMAHGFSAERKYGLPAFAERMAASGMAVLLFDHRSFGDSEGTPRDWVSPRRHLEDWQAAIAHARNLSDVDGTRLALWGSSYSGGHVIVTAARTSGIAGIVAQVPHVDSFASLRQFGLGFVLQCLPHIFLDLVNAALGREPHYVKAVAEPGQFAALNTPECYSGYSALIPSGADWSNRVTARSLLTFVFYSPARFASRVTCPALIMLGENDSLIPSHAVSRMVKGMQHAELERYPIGHFGIYRGEYFEKAIARQIEFLRTHFRL